MLERKYVMHDWSMRVNLSLLGMCIVDAWLLHSGARGAARTMLQHQFYEQLALELIENSFDNVGLRRRGAEDETATVLVPTTGVGPHATPTKKTRRYAPARSFVTGSSATAEYASGIERRGYVQNVETTASPTFMCATPVKAACASLSTTQKLIRLNDSPAHCCTDNTDVTVIQTIASITIVFIHLTRDTVFTRIALLCIASTFAIQETGRPA
jgi:hypothetical protein